MSATPAGVPVQVDDVVQLLTGIWRRDPPELSLAPDVLEWLLPHFADSGMEPLAWKRTESTELVDAPGLTQLCDAYKYAVLRDAVNRYELRQVLDRLAAADVPSILFKGWALSRLYPESFLRPFKDHDLYIHPAHAARALKALRGSVGAGSEVDLHHADLDEQSEAAWEALEARSQIVTLDDLPVRVMAPEDHLRLICLHAWRHAAEYPIRPLWLCDIGVVVESRGVEYDWGLALGPDKRSRDIVSSLVAVAHRLVGVDLTGTPVESRADQLPRWLVGTMLKQWARQFVEGRRSTRHDAKFSAYITRPREALQALSDRWPDPIEASVFCNAPINGFPRLPYQMWEAASRGAGLIGGAVYRA